MHQQEQLTPLMQQYFEIRSQHPDALLLFQVGDFYELFYDDAKKASAFLGIALTTRGKNNGEPIPLCGVPVHALDHYVTKLVRGGFKIALCDQLEVAQPGKMVRRGVTRVLTPGTLTESSLLEEKAASYLFSFFPLENACGLVFGELLTGQLFGTVLPASSERHIEAELVRFFPDEVIVPTTTLGKEFQRYFAQAGYFTSPVMVSEHDTSEQEAFARWIAPFKPEVQAYIQQHKPLRAALYAFFSYVRMTQQASLNQVASLHVYKSDDYLVLDRATQRNLELIKNNHDGSAKRTLFSVVDGALTPMGSRMIRKWLMRPLVKKEAIEQRLDVVQAYVTDVTSRQQLEDLCRQIGDIERVIGRVALARAQVHDYLHLARVMRLVPLLKQVMEQYSSLPLMHNLTTHIGHFDELTALLNASLYDDAAHDWIIKPGFHAELDRIRDLVVNSSAKIIELEQAEQRATGIGSLKIRCNDAHGYYIEVTNTHADAIPAHYIRRQTLVGRERYTTAALRELEHEISTARVRAQQLEKELFDQVKSAVASVVTDLRKLAHSVAYVDALLGLARVAHNNAYIRPIYTNDRDIAITAGRHPVVETMVSGQFIANDTYMTNEQALWIITGPNMGGKSTYLRQVALICIMGQIGSFVPAQAAHLPVLDRIFTRIGAGDNLSEGKSTFLVEMEETAAICAQATERSLVILDEVGRGTSTFDGLAIAQAVVEYIYTRVKARCLFATHYQELTTLCHTYPAIVNYYAASRRSHQGITFLYTMVPGIADGSFGIEVAKLALLPAEVIQRAQAIVRTLENSTVYTMANSVVTSPEQTSPKVEQDGVRNLLKGVDYDHLSPKQAFDLVWQLRDLVGHERS